MIANVSRQQCYVMPSVIGVYRTSANEDEYGIGGWGGIRTHETVAGLPVFKTGPFNHSGTHPYLQCQVLVIWAASVNPDCG